MRQISPIAALLAAALAATLAAPVASATVDVGDVRDIVACHNTGPQGTIATVPYFVWTSGTYWQGPYYYVDYSVSYEKVERYNHCVAGIQVGAVNVGYSHTSYYSSCVNCVTIGTLLA